VLETSGEEAGMKQWYVGDVMTRDVVMVTADVGYKAIADLMVQHSVSAVPVVDADHAVLGVVSEADLLAKLEYPDREPPHLLLARRTRDGRRKAAGDTAGELMTAPAVTVRATATVTAAARLMEASRIKLMPVVDDGDRLVGIVSRRDLVRLFTSPDDDLRQVVLEGVLRSLWIDQTAVDVVVSSGVVTLAGHVYRRSLGDIVVACTRATPGVVDVVDELTYDIDDRDEVRPGWYRTHPFSSYREQVDPR
jgi:CBS domain-containing protein